jgi:hypothetical protein
VASPDAILEGCLVSEMEYHVNGEWQAYFAIAAGFLVEFEPIANVAQR